VRFTALLHHVTLEGLRTAFLTLRRDAAPGIDGETWTHYAVEMEERLQISTNGAGGAYRAKPSRRCSFEAGWASEGMGVAALEDKIVQRASSSPERDLREGLPRLLLRASGHHYASISGPTNGGSGMRGWTWSSCRFADDVVVGFQHRSDGTVREDFANDSRGFNLETAPREDAPRRVWPVRG